MDSAVVAEKDIRQLLEFKMELLPYLYSAFADYHFKGIPPFMAFLVGDP